MTDPFLLFANPISRLTRTVHAAAPALPDVAQPSPVFYVDLKEGRRIDCNVLVRAHNVVYHAPEDGCVCV